MIRKQQKKLKVFELAGNGMARKKYKFAPTESQNFVKLYTSKTPNWNEVFSIGKQENSERAIELSESPIKQQLRTPGRNLWSAKSLKSLASAATSVPKSDVSRLLKDYPNNFSRAKTPGGPRPISGSIFSKKTPTTSQIGNSFDASSPQMKRKPITPGTFLVKPETLPFFVYSKRPNKHY